MNTSCGDAFRKWGGRWGATATTVEPKIEGATEKNLRTKVVDVIQVLS